VQHDEQCSSLHAEGLKHVQSYKYEENLQEYDMKLQNISYTKTQLLATSDSYWIWMLQ